MEVSRLNSSSHSDRVACPDRLGDSNELSSSESAIYERVGRHHMKKNRFVTTEDVATEVTEEETKE